MIQVGTIVRAPRDRKRSGRAMVATMEGNVVTVLWEDASPTPIQGHFLVAPTWQEHSDDEESTFLQSNLMELLDFERDPAPQGELLPPYTWKDRGDQLLHLGDHSSAIRYYEMALSFTNKLQVGCTVLIQPIETVLLADVDCLEETTADLTLIASGNEMSAVQQSMILLSLSPQHAVLQLRLLLNLARCLIQLADYDNTLLLRPGAYRKCAVMCTSMAYVMTTTTEDFKAFQPKCLLLRSKAHASQGQYVASMLDIETLLTMQATHIKEATLWKHELLALMKQQQATNKKLVKGMCQWIKSATADQDECGSTNSQRSKTTKSPLVSRTSALKYQGNSILPGGKVKSHSFLSFVMFAGILIIAFLYQLHK
jgi:hypothetical protein